MVVIGSVDFEGREEIIESLKVSLKSERFKRLKKNIVFDENNQTVWIIWDKKE